MLLLSACATANLTESGRLTSYANLQPSDGVLTKSKVYVEAKDVLAARTLRLDPTIVDGRANGSGLTPKQLQLVSNAVDRSLCLNFSRRFVIVEPGQPADLVVQAVITNLTKTDTTAAGVSVAAGLGGKVASAATGIPLPIPRLPLGLGSLSVEAEAKDRGERQVAALVWARGADSLTTDARVAEEADAHTLASAFAADFSKLLVTGKDPIAGFTPPSLPSADSVNEYFGAEAKYAACRQFGRQHGLGNSIGAKIGVPPSWTDDGGKRN